jgi:hypothetical protein
MRELSAPEMRPMKKGEVETAMPHLCEKWAKETKQPWPPDSQYHFSFTSFWSWLEDNHWLYTQFRAIPNARYVTEMWFDKIMKQARRN